MSAAKVRNLETMFHTRTIKRADALIRICNLFAFNFPLAETDDKKFVLVVLKAAKLSKLRNFLRNKTFTFSCQTSGFIRGVWLFYWLVTFLFERKLLFIK
jgi:hypothetical protein